MITCLIIDDDLSCIETLSLMLSKHAQNIKIIGIAQNLTNAQNLINHLNPQLLFLDVELNGEKGFDLFKIFPEPHFEVIFTTAYEKYAVQAIKHACFDFLPKPINETELIDSMNRLTDTIAKKESKKRVNVLLEAINTKVIKRIAIPSHDSITFVNVDDIVACLGESKYTTIYTNKNEKIVSSKNLGEFEDVLVLPAFFRSHKSWIINIENVIKFNKTDNTVLLNHNITAEVSTRKKDEFLKLFEKF